METALAIAAMSQNQNAVSGIHAPAGRCAMTVSVRRRRRPMQMAMVSLMLRIIARIQVMRIRLTLMEMVPATHARSSSVVTIPNVHAGNAVDGGGSVNRATTRFDTVLSGP